MPTFQVTVDVKETIWHRCSAEIHADTLEDAQAEMIRRRENDEYENITADYILETGCVLSKQELFVLNNMDMCLPDCNECADEIANMGVYDFPESENYLIDDDDENDD